jgi:Flp pilus assembly protein TadB
VPMPLSEHEQRILEDIERRLQQEDPRFAHQVERSSLHSHLSRRIRWGALAFLAGFVMLLLFIVSLWVALAGFGVMLASALFVYNQLRRMGGDQIRAVGEGPPLPAFLARLFQRFRGEPKS